MNQTVVDIVGFQKAVGIDNDTLKELFFVFIDELIKEKDTANKHFALGEVGELRKAVHNIKGIASSYRTHKVFENARTLDAKLKSQEYEKLNNFVVDLNKEIDEAVSEIIKYFKE